MNTFFKKNTIIASIIVIAIISGSTANASFLDFFNNFFGNKTTTSQNNTIKSESTTVKTNTTETTTSKTVKTTPVKTNTTPSKTDKIVKSGVERSKLLKVISVSDGDTIKVVEDGITKTIRILGIDTPEKFVTRTGYKECYGEEASKYAKDMLLNKSVYIERDFSQDDKDKYGRYLRHVFYEDGTMYQLDSIMKGYGFYYFYKKATFYDVLLKEAQEIAKKDNVGVWKSCNGKREEMKQ